MGSFRILPALAAAGVLIVIIALTLAGWRATKVATYAARAGDDAVAGDLAAIARHSGTLASFAGAPTSADMTAADLADRSAAVDSAATAIAGHLQSLSDAGYDDYLVAIRAHSDALLDNTRRINEARPELHRLLQEGRQNYRRFSYDYNHDFIYALVTSLDDQLYAMMSWRVEPGGSPNPADNPVSRRAVLSYHHTFELLAAARVAVSKLQEASVLSQPYQVVIVREEYEAAAQRMRSSMDDHIINPDDDTAGLPSEVVRLAQEILDAGEGENNLFQALERRLQLSESERRMIADNRMALDNLHAEVDGLLANARLRAELRAAAMSADADTLRVILLAIGIVGVAGALAATAAYYAIRARRN